MTLTEQDAKSEGGRKVTLRKQPINHLIMNYEFKKTEKVVNGVNHSVSLSEGELTYRVDICEDNVVVERYIQAKSTRYCRWHKRCSNEHEMLCMPGEIMNTAHNIYEQESAKLLTK